MLNEKQVAFRADRASIVKAIQEAGSELTGNNCRCPFHDDNRPSASIYQADDGAWKLHCQVKGCFHGDVFDVIARTTRRKPGDVMRALRDLPTSIGVPPKPYVKPVRHYDRDEIDNFYNLKVVREYHDPDGSVHGLVAIFKTNPNEKKDIRQMRPHDGSYIYKGPSAPHPLYRGASIEAASAVLVVEGESCVERGIEGYADPSVAFVTSMGGAGKAALSDWSPLAGKRVWLWPDNDAPDPNMGISVGVAHMESVRDILLKLTPPATVYWIEPKNLQLPEKGDLVDYLDGYCNESWNDHTALDRVMAGATLVVDVPTLNEAPVADEAVSQPMVEDEVIADIPTPVIATVAKTNDWEIDFYQFDKKYPKLREPLIHGLLREGETANIVAASKSGKSWLVLDLALSVITGGDWLGFRCEKGKVLIVDNELHGETISDRVKKVATEKGMTIHDYAPDLVIRNLRGDLKDIHHLGAMFDTITPKKYKLIVIDAMYRALPSGVSELDAGAMAHIYNLVDGHASRLGCCFALILHSTKGNQSDKSTIDVGSGTGVMGRATDAHLVMREHESDGVMVVDGNVRSFPPIEPRCVRRATLGYVWNLVDGYDPDDLKTLKKKKRSGPVEPDMNTTTFAEEFFSKTGARKDDLMVKAGAAGINQRQFDRYLRAAKDEGLIRVADKKNNNQKDLWIRV